MSRRNISRRRFLTTTSLMGAGAMLPLGRSGAGMLFKELIPSDEFIPGVSYWLHSTCGECAAGCGVKVRVRDGNATKIEGNERHPINHGGLCARGQSALQGLYSPARITQPLRRTDAGILEPTTWEAALKLIAQSGNGGALNIISRQVTGALRAMLDERAAEHKDIRVLIHEPLDFAPIAKANRLCFGIEAVPTYKLENARTLVSFGADLFETWISPVSNAYGFGQTRHAESGSMGRFIQFESHLSLSGMNADERYLCTPGSETLVALAVASLLVNEESTALEQRDTWRAALKAFTVERAAEAGGIAPEVIRATAEKLRRQSPSLVVAGGPTSRHTHATSVQVAVNLINYIVGNYGRTLGFDRTEHAPAGTYKQLLELVEDMEAGRVRALIVHETEPVFAFPDSKRWNEALTRVPLKIQLASVRSDSASGYDLVLPIHHWLEQWGMPEPRSGLHCVQQPVVKPLYGSRNAGQVLGDVLDVWAGSPGRLDYEKFIEAEWERIRKQSAPGSEFEDFWRDVLEAGGSWSDPVRQRLSLDAKAAEAIEALASETFTADAHVLLPITTVRYGDGRHTGMPWLSELPDPVTTIVWDNPLLISQATAKRWKCRSHDMVRLKCGDKTVEAPVYVQPGTSDAVVAIALGAASPGYAPYHAFSGGHPLHRLAGEFDALSGSLAWLGTSVEFAEVVGRRPLARMQGGDDQTGRHIAQAVSLDRLHEVKGSQEHKNDITDLYPVHEHPTHDWSMAIDLSLCIGCGNCVVACMAENNVFVVGKKLCLMGRELSWLRIERFLDHGRPVFLPMLCQHCEHAPCETVCPVYAAVHNSEGLNLQVYNRCVGTRYCANNCPYKVRRFDWYTYKVDPPLERQFNPDVYVRTRGIMEKCTFCVHRIREHSGNAKDEKRPLRDGEVVPACAQSCPTGAIVFGDLNDPESGVSRLFNDRRGYRIFEELNTQPSIVYLRRVHQPDATPMAKL
ncbi:MAG: TAT-variant-translocated molybdopterin oxidoreductase [Candidatus Abyssubacteria bacterium]